MHDALNHLNSVDPTEPNVFTSGSVKSTDVVIFVNGLDFTITLVLVIQPQPVNVARNCIIILTNFIVSSAGYMCVQHTPRTLF